PGAAAEIERVREAPIQTEEIVDSIAQKSRPAIMKRVAEFALEARGVLIKQCADIGLRLRAGLFARAEPREPQGRSQPVLGIARECAAIGFDRATAVAGLLARATEQEP